MKEITINNEIYIKKSESEYQPSPIQILVLNRGWNVIGNVREKDGKTYITNASIIRRWGTTQGLGELAIKGKLPETILDKCLDISLDTANVIFCMNCDQSKW
jgi:hypothetical protein